MLLQLQKLNRTWELHYSVRTRAEAAFLEEMQLLGSHVHLHVDEEQGGYVDIDGIVSGAACGAHLYCCGPAPMLGAFKAACAGRPQKYVHFEYFGAAPLASAARQFVVHLARMGKDVVVPEGVTILDALAGVGVEIPASCRQGVCGVCETRVIDGVPDHRDVILTADEKKKNRTMMVCCSGCVGDRIVLDI
jgi:ferredoxin